jgi:hypothetical protein
MVDGGRLSGHVALVEWDRSSGASVASHHIDCGIFGCHSTRGTCRNLDVIDTKEQDPRAP